jgi:hypothetical protein
MLVKVVARSLPVPQFVEKSEVPNGVDDPRRLVRCGMDPARSRDIALEFDILPESIMDIEGGLNGLVEGVGLEVLDKKDCGTLTPLSVPTGEKREGTVPARARRTEPDEVFSVWGTRSGKPSWLGDSGIFSRRGVEFPLVGGPGPQMCGESPS